MPSFRGQRNGPSSTASLSLQREAAFPIQHTPPLPSTALISTPKTLLKLYPKPPYPPEDRGPPARPGQGWGLIEIGQGSGELFKGLRPGRPPPHPPPKPQLQNEKARQASDPNPTARPSPADLRAERAGVFNCAENQHTDGSTKPSRAS